MKLRQYCIFGIFLYSFLSASVCAQDWPLHNAPWFIVLEKDVNTVPIPHEPSDLVWFHLHRAHPTLPDALSNVIAPVFVNGYNRMEPSASGLQLRYTVHDVPVSPWLDPPFRFQLQIDNPALSLLSDGVHDLSVEVQGASRAQFKPMRAFVHISRDKTLGEPFGYSTLVPIINKTQFEGNISPHFGPGVVYVDPADRQHIGFPVDSEVTAWQQPPTEASLYQEQMGPHTELFHAVQMWWDHPAHPGAPFVRGISPQHGEDHRNLRVNDRHERFPMSDGPRGIGWVSPYIGGQVDSQGRLAFAEVGGRVGYLLPDGEIVTVAGWRVAPGKDPIWWGKPTAKVRQNMQLRGNWQSGRGEFLTPLDVAIDPQNESIWYVVGYEDHVIWKVELPDDLYTQEAIVSVFAGDPEHGAGNTDGSGDQARFNGPSSIVFDPVNDVMYVADQDNDSIRRISRSGDVTTLFGAPGMRARLESQGVDWTDQLASRAVSEFEVSVVQAGQGIRPDIFLPQVIRVDSAGNLILLEIGYGAIRRIDPLTGVTETLGEVRQKHAEFDRGWAWLDVDRYGNSGPKNGIYWIKFVNTLTGEPNSEVYSWLPADGGESLPLFSTPTGLYPDGWGRLAQTNPPHYPWLVAVDPRGAVLLAGGGEHGVTRLRVQRNDDPVETPDYWYGRQVWSSGSNTGGTIPANSFALKFGYSGQNYLGFTNAWSLGDATDEQLLDAFDVPDVLRNDPASRTQWLAFVRPNTHSNAPSIPFPTPAAVPALQLQNDGWQQFTLPCQATAGTSINDLFGDDDLGRYGIDWAIWEFDVAANQYQMLAIQASLKQGEGYWIYNQSGSGRQLTMPETCASTPLEISAACPVSAGCFTVPIVDRSEAGDTASSYQMVGYPFAQAGLFSDVRVVTVSGDCAEGCVLGSAAANEIIVPQFWSYNGAEFDTTGPGGSFNPWAGYWIMTLSGATEAGAKLLFGQQMEGR